MPAKKSVPASNKQHRIKKDTVTGQKRVWWRWLLTGLLVLFILFRLFLPYIVLHYVNNKLTEMAQYYGHVQDIDIALLRGAYVIKEIKIVRINTEKKDTIPFFTSPDIDLSVEWKAIFKGAVVGKIYVNDPVLNFVKGKHKNEDLKTDTTDFRKLIRKLMPLTLNHFEIRNGQIHYIDDNSAPPLNVALMAVNAVATNLSNVNDSAKLLPAHLKATGHAYAGEFKMNVDFDAFAGAPTFYLNAELTNLDLVKVNDFFKAYGNFEVKSGKFSLYTEFAAKKGRFGGYVKPIIKDMKVIQGKGDLKQVIWEALVGGAAVVLKNQAADQVATKVLIEGRFDGPDINLWRAVSYILRNAFVQALKPAIDNSINIRKLEDDGKKTFLEKVFGKKKK